MSFFFFSVEITCSKKDVENADIDGIVKYEYAYEEKVKYVCKRGYEGSFTLTCGRDRWHGSEQCLSKNTLHNTEATFTLQAISHMGPMSDFL